MLEHDREQWAPILQQDHAQKSDTARGGSAL
jgi:hypothetical protein